MYQKHFFFFVEHIDNFLGINYRQNVPIDQTLNQPVFFQEQIYLLFRGWFLPSLSAHDADTNFQQQGEWIAKEMYMQTFILLKDKCGSCGFCLV